MNSGDGIEEYVKRLLTDTLSSDGPDILMIDSMSARKLEKSRMLIDLKPLIAKDKDFNKDDYNMKVIKAGMYEGKQVLMPLDYSVNQYITTEEDTSEHEQTVTINTVGTHKIKVESTDNLDNTKKEILLLL